MILIEFTPTAQKIVEQNPELEELTNLDIFLVARNVEQTLSQQQTQAALAWIHDHKSKLRKIKSTLEFHLRQQEFVELIKSDCRMDAVKHARKYLTNMEDVPWEEVQHCMALLAFPSDTSQCPHTIQLNPFNKRLFLRCISIQRAAGQQSVERSHRRFPTGLFPSLSTCSSLSFGRCSPSRIISHENTVIIHYYC